MSSLGGKPMGQRELIRASAHGRVNLIGEHTDYNGGFVLPTSIPQSTRVEIRPKTKSDLQVSIESSGFQKVIRYEIGSEKKNDDWADYVRGITWILAREGHQVPGFDVRINSTVPVGSGLSSSAALEVALLRGLRDAFSLPLTEVQIAQLGQRVENDFVGARVGIMDQMAASLADPKHALFLDTRDLSYQKVPLPLDRADLIVINSGISHKNVGSNSGADYNTRRGECERSCERLGVNQLRDLGPEALKSAAFLALPEVLQKRSRHVILENARVLSTVQALEAGDLAAVGRLFGESHRSMRDDYEVSIPEIDVLVEIAAAQSGVFGARLTGGGFGGSIVALARAGEGRRIADQIAKLYSEQINEKATVLVPGAGP